jgi:hypothetical protein
MATSNLSRRSFRSKIIIARLQSYRVEMPNVLFPGKLPLPVLQTLHSERGSRSPSPRGVAREEACAGMMIVKARCKVMA